jgi:hypothetical protein
MSKNPSQLPYSLAKKTLINVSDLLPKSKIMLQTELKMIIENQYMFCKFVIKNEAINDIRTSDITSIGLNVESNGMSSNPNNSINPINTLR